MFCGILLYFWAGAYYVRLCAPLIYLVRFALKYYDRISFIVAYSTVYDGYSCFRALRFWSGGIADT